MKVKELVELLVNMDPEREVIIQKDAEGNGYSPLAGADDECVYGAESTWSGTVYSADDIEDGYGEDGEPCVVLWPVN